MRRLPPNKIEQNLNGLLNLIPEETDELLQRVDQPLKEGTDPETVKFRQNLAISHMFWHVMQSDCYFRVANTFFVTTTEMAIHTGMICKKIRIFGFTIGAPAADC